MSSPKKTTLGRRQFLKLAGAALAAGALASCRPAAAPPVEPTAPPTEPPAPTKLPVSEATPTAAAAPTATTASAVEAPAPTPTLGDPWAIYPDDDPRHWVLKELVEPAKKFDNLEITTNVWVAGSTFPEGDSVEDNVVLRFLKEKTGVYWKPVWSGADWQQYWTTALASGDLADVMCNANWQYYGQLREADALEDITELWEKTASDLTKKYKDYRKDSLLWKFVTDQGRIYGVPGGTGGADVMDDVLWVRQDWLDKLGLKFPDTLDDLYQVGMAFKEAGLAKFGLWVGNLYSNMWGTMSFVFGAFGNPSQLWKRGADGTLAYTSLEPTQKQALEVLARWYKEGFLDPEFLTGFDAAKYLGGNLVGIGVGPYWLNAWPLGDSRRNDSEAKWIAGHLPAGLGGKRGRFEETYTGVLTAFRKGIDPQKVEAFIETMNWWYEITEKSQIPGWVMNFKGSDYDLKDGKLEAGKFSTFRYVGGPLDQNGRSSIYNTTPAVEKFFELANADPATLNPAQQFAVLDPIGMVLTADAYRLSSSIDYSISSDFIWTLPSLYADIQTAVNNLESEAYANIITGKADVSAWDKFVEDWKKQGGEEITKSVNEEDAKHK